MTSTAPKVIIIPAKSKAEMEKQIPRRQLRVAAYCRVSTDSEDQLTSYQAQKTYYTDKIMSNPAWTMAGIYADEGITGTSARKRPEFLKMMRHCRQHKIDVILTKSIPRFARNTVDCLSYVRALTELGIAVIFEEHNINTLEMDSEMLITVLGALAQSESENISANVRWGKREAMREGRVSIAYHHLYGYEKGEDGKPKIIPEQAEVVRRLYRMYLTGASLRDMKQMLETEQILNVRGTTEWTIQTIRSILSNEKYCGDVLMQKTFISDCISRKVIKNTGQLPMYLIQNHHEGIVDRETFDAVQTEMARRNAGKSPSKKYTTGRSCYSGKYALTERLVCGECGTLYRRCTWSRNGKKRIVWRCVSRLDYGTKYCHNSPTLDEEPLQKSILAALNSVMIDRGTLMGDITNMMESELVQFSGGGMSLGDIDRRLEEINTETRNTMIEAVRSGKQEQYTAVFQALTQETADLKEKKAKLEAQRGQNTEATHRLKRTAAALERAPAEFTEWDESTIRQLIDIVKVLSKDKIEVHLRSGTVIEQDMIN